MFSTPRLTIRPIQEQDFKALLTVYNNPNNMRFIETGKHDWTIEELKNKWKKFGYDEKMKTGFYVVVLKTSNKIIGECGFLKLGDSTEEQEIGFMVDKEYWGRGFGFEICRRLIPLAFEEIGLEKIKAGLYKENIKSSRLLKKFNFVLIKSEIISSGLEVEGYELSKSDYFEKVIIQDYFVQETERLSLRRLTEEYVVQWIDFFDNNNSLRFLGLDLTEDKTTMAKGWVMKQLDRYRDQALGHLAITDKSTNQFIGMAGIIPRQLNQQNYLEIAYSLKPPFWGKGYGTEVAQQLKKFGFENQYADQFISIIEKENVASIHVAKKNGMKVLFESEYLGMDVFVFGT